MFKFGVYSTLLQQDYKEFVLSMFISKLNAFVEQIFFTEQLNSVKASDLL